jgi:hypothetical protein
MVPLSADIVDVSHYPAAFFTLALPTYYFLSLWERTEVRALALNYRLLVLFVFTSSPIGRGSR